jgi:hypothetical protein
MHDTNNGSFVSLNYPTNCTYFYISTSDYLAMPHISTLRFVLNITRTSLPATPPLAPYQ